MKHKLILGMASILTLTVVFIGCSKKEEVAMTASQPTETGTSSEIDTMTTASIVNTAEGFIQSASQEGNWITAVTQDLTIDKDVVLDGEFVHRDEIYRKIALYDQDADHNVTARYTLKAPSLTVKSENARIQGGTFVGDVYVEANKFHIFDGTVDGDIYFASEEFKTSFELLEGGTHTGALIVK
ncbi:hypothetical protein EXM22_09950 [Oceanispirochaeta crateris]|uniref:Polymer-forming cytoskeletal protein n=1 Tax=Oceanispirochaeta crateris TaxID=2518645 RepID=A0A5C1QJF6_9SPIO|nr:hypothetical protein [Oceanispirochaeta crateris]QEN08295.1 hypothetical protein EXM22_09950 [Oceanispirochaeta crateris]